VLFYGEQEQKAEHFHLKNLKTWEQMTYQFEYAYGIALVHVGSEESEILLVKHDAGHRGIPKWHLEQWEDSYTWAMRELKEETWCEVVVTSDEPSVSERYINPERKTLKRVIYFIIKTDKTKHTLTPQHGEIAELSWIPFSKAQTIVTHATTRHTLQKISYHV
jgi:8-oxo-dGTP pyrophosphatase MutT (NUDIX family)